MDGDWQEYWDDNHGHTYYFNAKTGESKWKEEEEEDIENHSFLNAADSSSFHSNTIAGTSVLKGRGNTTSTSITATMSDNSGGTSAVGGGSRGASRLEEDEEDNIYLINDSDRVVADTESRIRSHVRCMYCTACLFEGPCAFLETIVRSLIFLIATIVCALLAIIVTSSKAYYVEQAKKLLRETIICAAAALSLALIPCVPCTIYRNYKEDEDWDLAPIPSIVGWIDTRRYMAFCYGGGAMAQTTENTINQNKLLDFHMKSSVDSWPGSILFSPRKVSSTCSHILNVQEKDLSEFHDIEEEIVATVNL